MLHKRSDQDVIEQVRNDPRVREVLDMYHKFLNEPDEFKELTRLFLKSYRHLYGGMRLDAEKSALNSVIWRAAKVYYEVVGKSPRSWEGTDGKRAFDPVVIGLFRQEGLTPPTGNQIKQAIRKKQ